MVCLFLISCIIMSLISNGPCAADITKGVQVPNFQQLMSVLCAETSPTIVHDGPHADTAAVLSSITDNQRVQIYEYHLFHSFLENYIVAVLENATLKEYHRLLSFLVICGNECVKDVVNNATELDKTIGQRTLLRHFSTWMIISPDTPSQLNTTLDNVAMIKISQENQLTNTGRSNNLRHHRNHITEKIKSWSSSVTQAYTLLWVSEGREWSRVHFPNMSENQLYGVMFPNRKRGLNGRKLILATLEWRPFAIRNVEECGEVSYGGAGLSVMDMLGKKFNFSYVIVEPVDMLWGEQLNNGTSTGVLGMIQRMEADTSPVLYAIGLERWKVIDISAPVTASEFIAIFKKRYKDNHSWLFLLSCFSWKVYLVGSLSLLWTVVLFIIMTMEGGFLNVELMPIFIDIGISVPMRQAIMNLPLKTSLRILTGTWCLFCMVITAVFTGNLVAFVTIDKYERPFSTLQELAQQDEYTVGTNEGGYIGTILMNSDDPHSKLIYEKINRDKTTGKHLRSTLAEDIQRVLIEKHVLITSNVVKDIATSVTCDILHIKERFGILHTGFPFPRHSPLRKLFDDYINLLNERGVFAKQIKSWTEKPKICSSSVHGPKLKLDNIKTAIVVSAIGFMVSVVILIFEIKWKC